MKDLLAELASEAASADLTSIPTEESSARLRNLGLELTAADQRIRDLERELKEVTSRRTEIAHREMPDLMFEIGQDRIGLPDVGEFGVDLVAEPYAHANIKSDWPEEQRDAAFAHLDSLGAGDLIKNVLTMEFPRGEHHRAQKFVVAVRMVLEAMHELGLELDGEFPEPKIEMTVPWNTLTAFVKEQIARGTVLELEKLGATVGTVVKIKPRKG